ncbi:hypothetical protein E2C01_052166 [Portunus trituberculatus]|uniref:Uncharacterized protein n=1 Tax=Portunus trituberculatus TaxID=210409 RepID=A0A5B7GDQ6_PORTR|nr:hypothetical protein [Portunus trituberculatus]
MTIRRPCVKPLPATGIAHSFPGNACLPARSSRAARGGAGRRIESLLGWRGRAGGECCDAGHDGVQQAGKGVGRGSQRGAGRPGRRAPARQIGRQDTAPPRGDPRCPSPPPPPGWTHLCLISQAGGRRDSTAGEPRPGQPGTPAAQNNAAAIG